MFARLRGAAPAPAPAPASASASAPTAAAASAAASAARAAPAPHDDDDALLFHVAEEGVERGNIMVAEALAHEGLMETRWRLAVQESNLLARRLNECTRELRDEGRKNKELQLTQRSAVTGCDSQKSPTQASYVSLLVFFFMCTPTPTPTPTLTPHRETGAFADLRKDSSSSTLPSPSGSDASVDEMHSVGTPPTLVQQRRDQRRQMLLHTLGNGVGGRRHTEAGCQTDILWGTASHPPFPPPPSPHSPPPSSHDSLT